MSAARNAGAAASSSEIIAFLDNDATADEHWLERVLAYFENPDCSAVERRIEAQGGVTPPTPFTHIPQNETDGRCMTCNMIFRKCVFNEVGGFDSGFPYFLEDSDLAFSFLERGHQIKYAKDVVVYHPRIRKPFRYHWWQMTGLAFRIPAPAMLIERYVGMREGDKLSRLDVLMECEVGTLVDVEMQCGPIEALEQGAMFYTSRIYSCALPEGDAYAQLPKCAVIFLLEDAYFK